ncbi:MAG TPA: DUF6766 family protein [Pseudolabrys sp.]|nr:DUF6766 family protein [Pseudolabrys sp.]
MPRPTGSRRSAAPSRLDRLGSFLRDSSLTLTLLGLFLVCLAATFAMGFELYREQHGTPHQTFIGYLTTGTFLNAIVVNCQAAILQLACLIIFGVFLVQRGATHSRKSTSRNRDLGGAALSTWFHRNSLGLAFVCTFLVAFVLHVITGLWAYNEQRALTHDPPLSLGAFVLSWKLWFMTFQTWQAEFFAIGFYMVLSIVLRQAGSPESKPVKASNSETGEANR